MISHEAGHFLVAYLLGLSLRGCVVNARDALKYPEISGQAGTIFFDQKLNDEMNNSKVTRQTLDRLSVVIMAGIAAEALRYEKAEGGADDERQVSIMFMFPLICCYSYFRPMYPPVGLAILIRHVMIEETDVLLCTLTLCCFRTKIRTKFEN